MCAGRCPLNQFLDTLEVSPYPDGVIWYLDSVLRYAGSIGTIIVPKGFETDFASVPQAFTNVFPRWSDYGLASIIHDWMYWDQAHPREVADAMFLEAMICLNVAAWKRLSLYRAVRIFGNAAWQDNARIAAQGYSRIRTAESPATPDWTRAMR